ncbi:casein kinase subunit II beta [Pyrrhoderma noxium]|uniref:Multifunctional fusion protein n=1 Tax=Pyrrhoderma noxium TaxID=2282107 RepID=A0A286UMN5_9AGAM|nr:casein kinase subunit II beta [Pyrrhoderma noxium]
MPRPQQHEFLPATGEDFNALALEGDEAMEEDMEQEGYASSTPTSSLTWIVWFCQLPGHEYFCEVSEDFIEDDFNLTGLNSMVPFWKEAMEMVLDVEPEEDSLKIPDVSIVEASAELLYGLVHQRYILTRAGLHAMAEKYEQGQFGTCPRVYCLGCHVVPCGRSDLPGIDTVKLYCPNCNDIYTPPSSRYQGVDGAFFGTTFAHLFFQTYREFAPAPFYTPSGTSSSTRSPASTTGSTSGNFVNPNPHGGQKPAAGRVYTPKIYGFRVSEKAKSGPRMRWLRLRPESAAELEQVDWKGRWITSDDNNYSDEEENMGPMEDFDPDAIGEDDDDEEEEEEEGDENAPVNTTNVTRGPHERSSSGQRTLRPPTPIHASAASSPPASSSVASPTIVSRTRKDPLASAELSLYGSATNSIKMVRNDTRRGLNKGHTTTLIPKSVKPSHKKGVQSTRTKFVRSIVREVVGFAPYERRVMELLRNSKDKRARKLTKKRLGTLLRSKRKLEELQGIIQESRRTGH